TDQVAKVSKTLRPFFLKMPAFKPVIVEAEAKRHRVYLNPDLYSAELETSTTLQELESSLIPVSEDEPRKYVGFQEHTLTYENFGYHDVFRAILPADIDSVSGFSTIGHIIHLNLRDEALPY